MLNLVELIAQSCRINKPGGPHGPGGTHGPGGPNGPGGLNIPGGPHGAGGPHGQGCGKVFGAWEPIICAWKYA